MKLGKYFILIIGTVIFFAYSARACTTLCFQYNNEWIYGRNYDWFIEHCLIVVNKRGVAKAALTQDDPAQWVSKYGSITFNQYGREFPLGGMNEAGLVIECMWLEQTEYSRPDSRNGLSDLQWIQYQLDNFSTVDEVIASDTMVRISVRSATPLHFLVCDRYGKAATIEFLGRRMVVHTGDDLSPTVLTNNTYEYSKRLFDIINGDETNEAFAAADYSVKRFIWAAQGVNNWNPESHGSPIDYTFEILDKVSINMTMFRIVYDVGNGRIYYRTKSNPDIRHINFNAFNFSCDKPARILDITSGKSGDVTELFSDYTYEANYGLIRRSFSETEFLRDTPQTLLETIARYPESLPCNE